MTSILILAQALSPAEKIVCVPRERKCPTFSGNAESSSSLDVDDWIEEACASIRSRHLSIKENAIFLFDHLAGDARTKIKFRPHSDREDPERIFAIFKRNL